MLTIELEKKSVAYRKKILYYIKKANAGHTGGSLSCIDILNVLYNNVLNVNPETINSPDRDRYVQSKGHSVEALYVVLADKGFFPESDLETLCQYKSHYVGHPTRKVNGIEQNTGGLGHGLAMSAGMAMSAKMDNKDYRVFTLLGDGELAEGSNWEAAMLISHYKLDNLTAIIDRNTLQITDRTSNVLSNEPLAEKFAAFGWAVKEVDGHDLAALSTILNKGAFEKGKPNLVIANTTKGKGISYMEDVLKWHHGVPSDEQYQLALKELAEKELLLKVK
ncbi:transketolase [Chondrinema litorale]|uniref:transketolase n=1 Tax=Chondrinema litorale TaxID=2994555 RepID=UPI0025433503|nr:transketolase [Chondrinema litorale]UZR98453.1 transketolase [Chondrinema litorale]